MKDIQPFIDLGFHTVPLKGELRRLEDGTKTTPKFQKNWRTHYQSNFNEEATAIGGTITGAISNIIAIDCDDQHTYDLFSALDGDNKFHFISKGKPKGGGTIIYKYPSASGLESFSIQNSLLRLDFYSDNGFVYLPTDKNESKVEWGFEQFEELPNLVPPPETVITLLNSLQYQYTLAKGAAKDDKKLPGINVRSSYLAPQLEMFCTKKIFIPSLFRIITPKDFRSLTEYTKHGYLHPKNVPEGRGSEYLSKVSAILGADPSVGEELYKHTIDIINGLWESPIVRKRLEQTIINPMVTGNSSINGEPIWQYDEHWKTRGLAFTTKLGDACEVFFDDIRASYYFINYTTDQIKIFYKSTELFEYIEPVAVALPVRKELKMMVPVVRTSIQPTLPFGFYSEDDYNREFNIFRQSPALSILNDPKPYEDLYKPPETISKFFETFIPDTYIRNYVLRFLKRKYTTFKYSPTLLYCLGKHGSGKDTFVNILSSIIGNPYVARPTAKEFLDQFNGWLVDKYFVQLDEYGNQLHTLMDKEIALGKIKAYTGKPETQIRQMRTDGFNYSHVATFIMTANSNPLLLEDGDRRMCFIDTPNVLKDADWVQASGGMTAVIEKINAEINDFAYYLATEVDAASWDEYMSPPMTDKKQYVIADSMPAAQKIAYCLKHAMFDVLEDAVEEFQCDNFFMHSTESRIFEEDLFELYQYLTDHRGTKRGLTKVMREHDFEKIPTSKEGIKKYYYSVKTLAHYKPRVFHDETTSQVDVEGLE
jgi:hypothetical protein